MAASPLSLVVESGRRLDTEHELDLPAARDPREAAFLQTMELAVRQARRILDRPAEHAAPLLRLCQAVLDQASAVTALEIGETEWGVEPFIGA